MESYRKHNSVDLMISFGVTVVKLERQLQAISQFKWHSNVRVIVGRTDGRALVRVGTI